jgi:hypothetical protein
LPAIVQANDAACALRENERWLVEDMLPDWALPAANVAGPARRSLIVRL